MIDKLKRLQLWMDPVERAGPEAMAVDEWLMETWEQPILRVYGWQGEWGSLGYFGKLADAKAAFPDLTWVRRWTGGGVVDHRSDWTYTLVIPKGEPLAVARGAESYCIIHAALAETLQTEGWKAQMSVGIEETGHASCFENPVDYDLIGPDGRKLAGAGQRRTRQGLLHQGSVAVRCADKLASRCRADAFANRLCLAGVEEISVVPGTQIFRRVAARYERDEWTRRR